MLFDRMSNQAYTEMYTCTLALTMVIVTTVYGQTVEILSGPEDHVAIPEEIVHFNCHARGTSVSWYVNGHTPVPLEEYRNRGFEFFYENLNNGEKNNTAIVVAHLANNNSIITCTARTFGQLDANQHGKLFIAGPPLSPPFNFTQKEIVDNIVKHTLDWDIPFTWFDFPIVNYTINVHNHLTGDTITITKSVDDLTYTYITYGRSCYELDFSLVALNRVGESEQIFIHTGHPIVWDTELEVEIDVLMQPNGTSNFQISFLGPRICPRYQTGTYSITIYDDASYQLTKLGPVVYQQENVDEKTLITEEVQLNTLGHYYEVEVTVERNGIFNSNRTRIKTEDSTAGSSNWPTSIIAGATVGGTLLFGMCFFIVMILLCKSHKKKNIISILAPLAQLSAQCQNHDVNVHEQHPKPLNLKLQACNPIYDGAVYETMPGESFKSLISPGSSSTPNTPNTPSAESASRYIFSYDTAPNVPPPRKGSVSYQPKLKKVEEKASEEEVHLSTFGLGDDYMIMSNPPLSKATSV